jgi:uncharacterized Tic20 family protein
MDTPPPPPQDAPPPQPDSSAPAAPPLQNLSPQGLPPPLQPASGSDAAERQWAIGIHLSALLGFFGPHLFNVLGPLIIWLIKKQDSPYLDAVGKRVLNFQISYSIYGFVAFTLICSLWWLVIGLFLIPLYVIIAVAWLLFTIIGAMKESNGETYEFPFVIKFFP